jgi:hypothetical protein
MPKRVPKIRFPGHVGNVVTTKFPDDQIPRIQEAYGFKLPEKAWDQIRVATVFCNLASGAKRHQISVKTFLREIKVLQASAQKLRDAIFNEPSSLALSKAPTHVNGRVDPDSTPSIRGFHPPLKDQQMFYRFVELLDELAITSEQITKETSSPAYEAYRQGAAWDAWVYLLTLIVKENGLPFQVRKDVDKQNDSEQVSPFVRFVHELQTNLPAAFHKSEPLHALSQAIVRARRSRGFNLSRALSPLWIDEMKRQFE